MTQHIAHNINAVEMVYKYLKRNKISETQNIVLNSFKVTYCPLLLRKRKHRFITKSGQQTTVRVRKMQVQNVCEMFEHFYCSHLPPIDAVI
jgi:hypothetical protein